MTVKLHSLARWAKLAPEKGVEFIGKELVERRVRVNLNLEAVTTMFIGQGKTETFLGTFGPGLETVEFNIAGSFVLFAEKGSATVMYQSADLEPTHSVVVDPKIFTRIANRRHRNPELEEMMFRATRNMENRLAQQANELQAAFERRMKEMDHGRPAEKVVSNAPGAAPSTGGAEVPAQVGAGDKPAPEPGGKDGGKPKTGTGTPDAGGTATT